MTSTFCIWSNWLHQSLHWSLEETLLMPKIHLSLFHIATRVPFLTSHQVKKSSVSSKLLSKSFCNPNTLHWNIYSKCESIGHGAFGGDIPYCWLSHDGRCLINAISGLVRRDTTGIILFPSLLSSLSKLRFLFSPLSFSFLSFLLWTFLPYLSLYYLPLL